jgi:RNA polymerase sigma-70 factor (ECF subfamily)
MTVAPRQLISPAEVASAGLEGRLVPFRPQVQRHILAMVRDRAEVEELTQDTYARALTRIGQLRDPQAALAWLYRIAPTVALDRLRQRRPPSINFDTVARSGEIENGLAGRKRRPSLLDALEQSEMSECVQGYLAALPDDYRIAILLHDAHGLSNPEIAELLGCSLATVKIRVHRARAGCARRLPRVHVRDRRARRARLRPAAGHPSEQHGAASGATAGCHVSFAGLFRALVSVRGLRRDQRAGASSPERRRNRRALR